MNQKLIETMNQKLQKFYIDKNVKIHAIENRVYKSGHEVVCFILDFPDILSGKSLCVLEIDICNDNLHDHYSSNDFLIQDVKKIMFVYLQSR